MMMEGYGCGEEEDEVRVWWLLGLVVAGVGGGGLMANHLSRTEAQLFIWTLWVLGCTT